MVAIKGCTWTPIILKDCGIQTKALMVLRNLVWLGKYSLYRYTTINLNYWHWAHGFMLLMLKSNPTILILQQKLRFSNLKMSNFGKLVSTQVLDSCSWLVWVKPDVICCCIPSATRFVSWAAFLLITLVKSGYFFRYISFLSAPEAFSSNLSHQQGISACWTTAYWMGFFPHINFCEL